jgi:glycosyltransferase involved in cell wall biosynthesis
MTLGIVRIPMSRHLGWRDFTARRRVAALAESARADVVHGHGAKGGAYARLTHGHSPGQPPVRVYTPHGGSLHYSRGSPLGLLYLTLEQILMPRTELFLFESAYGRDAFRARVGEPRGLVRVVHNGVTDAEFAPVIRSPDASDLVFVGELRALKGIDVLLQAIALLSAQGHRVTATVVGEGPDAQALRREAEALGLNEQVNFAGVLPAREAFARGRLLVVPSRAESLPYIALEAAAAGVPMVATSVGGIPEIFGADARELVSPGDAPALAQAIHRAMADATLTSQMSAHLQTRVRAHFSVTAMTEQVLAAYDEALAAR